MGLWLRGKTTSYGLSRISLRIRDQHAIASFGNPELIGIDTKKLSVIDSLANNAILNHATPGCVVLVVKDARIVYYKAFGYTTYDSTEATNLESIYDMASVTKVCATTISVMRLYDQGNLILRKSLAFIFHG